MISLWELLVVDMFNSFWLAVIGVVFAMWLIFMVGKVSQVTSLNFLSIFILAMAIGYSNPFIAILTTLLILVNQFFIIPKLING
jgi:hypothetical protein